MSQSNSNPYFEIKITVASQKVTVGHTQSNSHTYFEIKVTVKHKNVTVVHTKVTVTPTRKLVTVAHFY